MLSSVSHLSSAPDMTRALFLIENYNIVYCRRSVSPPYHSLLARKANEIVLVSLVYCEYVIFNVIFNMTLENVHVENSNGSKGSSNSFTKIASISVLRFIIKYKKYELYIFICRLPRKAKKKS